MRYSLIPAIGCNPICFRPSIRLSFWLVCAIAPFLSFTSAQAQLIGQDITSITTDTVSFPTTSITKVAGDSEFAGSTFNLNFGGEIQSITGFTITGGSATLRSIPAFVQIRRNPATDSRKQAYYQGSFDSSSNTFNFLGLGPLPEKTLFSINNILAGPDNVFTNTGANLGGRPYNGNASIERLDFVLVRPVKANNKIGFTIFERGLPTGHDGFGIAAITSVDKHGNPTSYGPIYIIAASTWGKTPLQDPIPQYYLLNNAANNNRGIPVNPALTIPSNQVLGGILIRTNELVSQGQKVYGYSLFASDVTCTPKTLLNVANSCFPTNTGTNGGIDLAAPNLGAVFLDSEWSATALLECKKDSEILAIAPQDGNGRIHHELVFWTNGLVFLNNGLVFLNNGLVFWTNGYSDNSQFVQCISPNSQPSARLQLARLRGNYDWSDS